MRKLLMIPMFRLAAFGFSLGCLATSLMRAWMWIMGGTIIDFLTFLVFAIIWGIIAKKLIDSCDEYTKWRNEHAKF